MRTTTALLLTAAFITTIQAQTVEWEAPNLTVGTTVNRLYVDSSGTVFAMVEGTQALYRSIDKGASWQKVHGSTVYAILDLPGGGLLAADVGHLLRSTDGGATWHELEATWNGVETREMPIYALFRDGNRIYAGGNFGHGQLWVSRDSARTWTLLNQPVLDLGYNYTVRDIYTRGDLIVYKHAGYGLWVSRDGGQTWTLKEDEVPSFIIAGGGFAYTTYYFPLEAFPDIVKTTDFETYTFVANDPAWLSQSAAMRDSIFVVASYEGPFVSTNYGCAWILPTEGLARHETPAAAIDADGYIYVGTLCCVQRSRNPMVVTATDRVEIPDHVALGPIYPNPFNRRTSLTLRLNRPQHIRVEAYNALGRRVHVLQDGVLPTGEHLMHFDAAGLLSGLYMIRIAGEQGVQTRSAVLLK